MSDLLVTRRGQAGFVTLNRPKALNALTHAMVIDMHAALRAFASEDAIKLVVVDGAGERGLCAGGDIRSIYDAQRIGDDLPARFWRDEYIMNRDIARYPKPYIAIMNGIVMGGGIGISAHGSHRIVTEKTRAAMPEVGIGFSPDVGGTYLLARAPDELGTYAGLTAAQMNAADAIQAGLADRHVATSELPELIAGLEQCADRNAIDRTIAKYASAPATGIFSGAREWIAACFRFDTVEEILGALAARAEPEASKAAAAMARHSPTSLKVALAAMRAARRLNDLEACLQMEYRVSLACIAAPDMIEGIRATVIDKDQAPHWSPSTLAGLTDETVAGYFAARPGDAIDFSRA